jgi:hypothetical protein
MTCKDAEHSLRGLIKASAYIESLFKKIGLETFDGAKESRICHDGVKTDLKVQIDGLIDKGAMISYTYQPEVSFEIVLLVVRIRAGDSFGPKFYEYYQSDKTCWFWLIVRLKKQLKICFIWQNGV